MNYFCGQQRVTSGVISPARAQKKGRGSLAESPGPSMPICRTEYSLIPLRINGVKADIQPIGAGAAYLGTKAGFRCANSFPAPIRSRQPR